MKAPTLLKVCWIGWAALFLAACSPNQKHVRNAYTSFRFDTSVIKKLRDYDSLVQAIEAVAPLFQKMISEKDSYRAYKYRPGSTDPEAFHQLPEGAGPDISRLYDKIGSDYIVGFDIFKDSSVKISIRSISSDSIPVIIDEALSYSPGSGTLQKREFPVRDTVLNKHWQYWVRIREMGYF